MDDMKIEVGLPDGGVVEFEKGVIIRNVIKDVDYKNTADVICAVKVNGQLKDLSQSLEENCKLELLTFKNSCEAKKTYWHTTAHIMAQAVGRLFKDVKFSIGPAIDSGFYYDFDSKTPITKDDLPKIEKEMKKIIKENFLVERESLPAVEAKKYMEERGQIYKVELIEDLFKSGNSEVTFRKQGEFVDLCGGPHLNSTGLVKSFKLLSCTGAYWRGDSKGKMLQRIYGISFPSKEELNDYLSMLEEAKKRDHRKIGKELRLFALFDEGQGFPFFLPNGIIIKNELINFWRKEHKKAGYVEISTPIILNKDLWVRSGHWDHYRENMYTTVIDEEDYAIKPMNCPGGMLVYRSSLHSYRDLPERVAELGLVHRHELSGTLHGLMRVRCFTQDDAHIFMMEDQVESEILGVIKLIDKFYSTFGFEYNIELSTRPESSMGTDEQWEKATDSLKKALKANGKDYKINEGDGAFYGPKIDFHLKDSIGRTWQCGTIQLDFQLPERFDLTYIGGDGQKHRPVMIHRVIFGSIERFIGILTEHFAGNFPLWLAPVQVVVLPVSEKFAAYANEVNDILVKNGIRSEVDSSNEKLNKRIRESEIRKVPYILVVGEKEQSQNEVSVRKRGSKNIELLSVESFLKNIVKKLDGCVIYKKDW